jgi:hypothetical protein
MTEHTACRLRDERTLEAAEETLTTWASQLAEDGRDGDAAEALRVSNIICKFRCGFLESEKEP